MKLKEELLKNIPELRISPSFILGVAGNPYFTLHQYINKDFSDSTNQSLMVGTAFHHGLEYYYNELKKLGNIDEEKKAELQLETQKRTDQKFYDQLDLQYAIGLNDLAKKFNIDIPVDGIGKPTKNYKFILGLLESSKNVKIKDDVFEKYKNKYIDGDLDIFRCKAQMENLVNNFFYNEIEFDKIIGAEITLTHVNKNNIPLKCKVDLTHTIGDDIIIRDFKSVASFNRSKEIFSWDIQGIFMAYNYEKLNGVRPKYVIFDQVLKGTNDPLKGLKKADLMNILTENNIEFPEKIKVDDLKNIIYQKELVKGEGKVEYIIDISKRKELYVILEDLIERTTNLMCLYVMCMKEKIEFLIPNDHDFIGGSASVDKYLERFIKVEEVEHIPPLEMNGKKIIEEIPDISLDNIDFPQEGYEVKAKIPDIKTPVAIPFKHLDFTFFKNKIEAGHDLVEELDILYKKFTITLDQKKSVYKYLKNYLGIDLNINGHDFFRGFQIEKEVEKTEEKVIEKSDSVDIELDDDLLDLFD